MLVKLMPQTNGGSHTLRSGVKVTFHAPFWRPVWEGDLPAEFNECCHLVEAIEPNYRKNIFLKN